MSEVDASSFHFQPPGARAGALCVHGLTGTPYEVRPVAETLAARGIAARGLMLPGHGTTPEELSATSHEAWLAAVRGALAEMREGHDQVFLVGMSLGAVLSLRTAQLEPVDGVVSIGAPLDLGGLLRRVIPFAKHLVRMMPKRGGSDIRDPAARARHPGYEVMPLHAVHELMRLQVEVIRDLDQVSAPTLVAHGEHDRTAQPRDARRIFDTISSVNKELLMLPDSGHVVPVDHDGEALSKRAADFLEALTA